MKLYKILMVTAGFLFVGLGIIGILLPILPTTPFMLLAAYCFVKGSDRFDRWFKQTQFHEKYVADFVKDRSMTMKRKIQLMTVSNAMLLVSFYFIDIIYLRIFIVVIALIKDWYFIFKIKTKKEVPQEVNSEIIG